jgi:hypothetical protein
MTKDIRDQHGRPPRAMYGPAALERDVTEMLGVVKGVICDGVLNDAEAVALEQWLRSHPDVAVTFPGNVLAERVQAIFEDGILDETERKELEEILQSLCGETEAQDGLLNRATRLPITQPMPSVFFDNHEFCFTGIFAYGTRADCERAVADRGGRCCKQPTGRTHYVVIGLVASDAWAQPTYGRKVEHAVHLRELGKPIAIISEEHWVEALRADA